MGRRLQRWSRFNYARPVITLPPSLGEERKKARKISLDRESDIFRASRENPYCCKDGRREGRDAKASGTCFSTGAPLSLSLNFVAKLILQLPGSALDRGHPGNGSRGGRMKLQGEARSPLGFKNRLKLRQDVVRIKRSGAHRGCEKSRGGSPSEKGIDTTVAKQQQQQQEQQEKEREEGKAATYGLSVKKSLHGMAALLRTARRVRVYTTWPLLAAETRRGLPRTDRLGRGWREASRMGT